MGSWYCAQAGSSTACAGPAGAKAASASTRVARAAMASTPQRGAGLPRHLGHDPRHHRVNFGVGQRALARLQGHANGDRLRALRQALALIDVEHANVGDKRAFRALRRLDKVAGADLFVNDERKVPLDRHEVRAIELRLRSGRLGLRWRNSVERDLEGDDRPFGVERFARARMQLSKPADDVLWPELERR